VAVGLQNGLACRRCTDGKCRDEPTADEPICFRVGGSEVEITSCPYRFIGANTRNLLAAAAMAKNGVLPTSGGWFDQSAWAIDGMEAVWSEQESQRRELSNHGTFD
jgi:hypothetical protein